MTISFRLVLLVLAFVLLSLSAANVPSGRINLLSAGLAVWVLALLVG